MLVLKPDAWSVFRPVVAMAIRLKSSTESMYCCLHLIDETVLIFQRLDVQDDQGARIKGG